MNDNRSFLDRMNHWTKNSIGLKIFTMVFLVLILLIPINMVEGLIWERESYRQEALNEISDVWGRQQTITGLVLTVPFYRYTTGKDDKGNEKVYKTTHLAHFLPEALNIKGIIEPERRHRGIYEVVVYTSKLSLDGSFVRPDFEKLNIHTGDVEWSQAYVSLGFTDLRTIQNEVTLDWAGTKLRFDPGVNDTDVLNSGISTAVPIDGDIQKYSFAFDLNFNGSDGMNFSPLGKVSTVDLSSTWPDPKFNGAFFPDNRNPDENGFTAHWEVLHLNRNFPQEFEGSIQTINSANFGVDLIMPVDQYQKSTRSMKYAVMIISLTFLIFFFSQIKNNLRIHPIQYLIVGLALCLFFILLIALSEHIGFGKAYLAGSAAIIGVITAYSFSFYKDKRLPMLLLGILILLYGFIYIIIQLQDYSLLIGSIGLFLILAAVMYLSRNIDWYGNVGEIAQE
jgi:inner membrane protein